MTMRMRWLSSKASASVAMLALGALPFLASCTSTQTTGTSSSYLIINSINAASGAQPSQFGGTLESDVLTKGSVLEDPGQVIFSLGLKDPGSASTPTTPTAANYITVTRYHVEYVRSDGRNTPGVDVPWPFDGGMTVTVGNANSTGAFVVVRVQAKIEAPLAALVNGGGAGVISTIARVTFYGTDQTGREVSVTGNISVNFADWADPS